MNPDLRSKLGNYWVFREGRRKVHGPGLLRKVLGAFHEVIGRQQRNDNDKVIPALVLAGELESSLADLGSPSIEVSQAITDVMADCLMGSDNLNAGTTNINLSRLSVPERITISPPEGFAYYALHPSDFANLAKQVPEQVGPIAVIGIRSIGTTLSAVVAAANRRIGRATERITVRPTGHPYDRMTDFTTGQHDWIASRISRGSQFQVVDEGPGRSGSSFLSVAEALMRSGIERDSITLLGSRAVQLSELCANNAADRWAKFHFYSPITQVYERFKNDFYVGGGQWRRFFEQPGAVWPACWPQMERLKFLSADRRILFKFEGFGQFGEEALNRATCLAEAGFGPVVENAGDGMLSYSVVHGSHAVQGTADANLLQRIAEYCAFRVRAFSYPENSASELWQMVSFNLQMEFGESLKFSPDLLATRNPVLVDGRMQPHEWIVRNDGTLIKVDGNSHGDDHFFPGPTDIAWDLAGTIVEWELDENATEFLLERYFRVSGDDARTRIAAFVLGYLVFRLAYCGMALTTAIGTAEEPALEAAYWTYRRLAAERLNQPGFSEAALSGASGSQIEETSSSRCAD